MSITYDYCVGVEGEGEGEGEGEEGEGEGEGEEEGEGEGECEPPVASADVMALRRWRSILKTIRRTGKTVIGTLVMVPQVLTGVRYTPMKARVNMRYILRCTTDAVLMITGFM